MTADTALRALSAIALLVVVIVGVLALQTRHAGTMHVTTVQKAVAICAAVVGLLAGALALLV